MCLSCFAIPTVTVQLLATAAAIVYGQRWLPGSKWVYRISLCLSYFVAVVLAAIGVLMLVLATNDDFRSRSFANICMKQNLRSTPLDEHRCGILEEGRLHGKVLEFGAGPGTNFKCFQNSTAARAIQKYVAVEPNTHFEEEILKERDVRGLGFPLEFVGIKGEDVLLDPQSDYYSYDAVVMTHLLCSVDSVESVLANAERALKPGGKLIFMEHVLAEEGTFMRLFQTNVVAPFLYILANGCTFRDLGTEIRTNLDKRFDVRVTEFEAPLPKFMLFARPHIKGIAVKK